MHTEENGVFALKIQVTVETSDKIKPAPSYVTKIKMEICFHKQPQLVVKNLYVR